MRTLGMTGVMLALGLLAGGCGGESPTGAGAGEAPTATPGETGTPTAAAAGAVDGIPISPENATVEWIGTKDEGKHDGGFRRFSGTCVFEGQDPTTARFTLEIDTTSIWSDTEKLTNHLKSADFFEVNEFPTAAFTTTSITAADGGGHTVTGDLTLHGVTKTISFPATIALADGVLDVQAEFTIDRFDFGIEYGKGKVHDDVTIKASFSGTR